MLENIKLDIIYYGTQKDFEMEFNLCGCCRMRLLTAVADDLKSFVNCIKIAVARSRVVLLCGNLDGDEGIFNIISKAVGREFEEVENSVYGIAGEGKTKLLKQSIPLVSNDGTFLGCVIEQGPQAIIMLSHIKDGRKEIMQNLIHPYVKELSKSEIVSSDETQSEQENIIPESNDLNQETDEVTATAETEEIAFDDSLEEDTLELDSSNPLTAEEQEVEIEDEDELETVSLEDFSKDEEEVSVTDTAETIADIEAEEETDIDNSGEEIIAKTNDENRGANSQHSGLVFGVPDDDLDESDQKLYSSDVLEEYTKNFSLVAHRYEKNKRYKHSRSNGSPVILILLCVVLCLLGILAYYLLVKPTQAGITVGENFNNLFSFALKGVNKLW